MEEREWIDVEDWHLRSMTPGASQIGSSWGSVETDARGAVIRVSGNWITGQRVEYDRDPDTGALMGAGHRVPTAYQKPHPTREMLLAHGYEDRAVFPLEAGDEYRVTIEKAPIEVEPERTIAETTHVEAQERSVAVEGSDSGEMGAPMDLAAVAAAAAAELEEKSSEEGYVSPFSDAPPPGTPANDPAHDPDEGAPPGEQIEDLLAGGAVEVIPEETD